jgi:MFS family permease
MYSLGGLIGAAGGAALLSSGLRPVTAAGVAALAAALLTGSFGVPAAQAGIGYALFSVAMTFGRLTGDRVVKGLGQRRVLLYGGLMVTAGLALLSLLPSVWVASGGFLLIGLGAANLVPILFSTAGRQEAMSPTLAIASMTTLGHAGIPLGRQP